jgi:hypothetical protein
VQFCLGRGILVSQSGQTPVLGFDEPETQSVQDRERHQAYQYEVVAFLFGQFAQLHRFLSG